MLSHHHWTVLVLTFAIPLHTTLRAEAAETDAKMVDRLFANWTRAFNNKEMAGSTNLFSKECIASLPDAPHKDYDAICNGFKKIFASKTDGLKYRYKIHKIFRSGDLATVRITWYSSAYKQNKLIATTTEQGLDVFKKEKDGWKIVNFIAYPEK
ncbi:MAG: nuclear transport factor 2 family protein [Candidatus Melainabacteria bacterium]|nr:nuclear transport factor 2 family protein [Candidatus Melainabacteria bacterium]